MNKDYEMWEIAYSWGENAKEMFDQQMIDETFTDIMKNKSEKVSKKDK